LRIGAAVAKIAVIPCLRCARRIDFRAYGTQCLE